LFDRTIKKPKGVSFIFSKELPFFNEDTCFSLSKERKKERKKEY
jgi:hypothetical protein